MYRIEFSYKAIKNLKKIPTEYRKLIMSKLDILAVNPFESINIKALKGFEDTYRLRVANYRIVYTVEDNKLLIFVVDINHRKDIYKKR